MLAGKMVKSLGAVLLGLGVLFAIEVVIDRTRKSDPDDDEHEDEDE